MKFNTGDTFVWWGVSSCTESLDVLNKEQFLGKTGTRTLFNIQCHNGKQIHLHSHYKHEHEVLLMPGTYFQVKSTIDVGSNLNIIHVQEATPPYVLCESPLDTLPYTNEPLEIAMRALDSTSELKLHNIGTNEEDTQVLVEALKVNKTLTTLNLAGNQISDGGGEALAEALKVNRALTTLFLGGNQISDGGGNQISDGGGEALADALKVNRALTTLFLGGNQISDGGGEALAEALKVNKTLTT
ncbi:unnamed protein product, partial [Didymodactylos carnosus]